jgi:hypothetical protein
VLLYSNNHDQSLTNDPFRNCRGNFVAGIVGILANLAIPLMPDYGNTQWNFFGPFEAWNDTDISGERHRDLRIPWWAISSQTPCPYLDPLLAGPVGYGFYALCFSWGMGTIVLLRSYFRSFAERGFWPVFLFWAGWLIGLGGIVAHVVIFVSIAREAARAGLTS